MLSTWPEWSDKAALSAAEALMPENLASRQDIDRAVASFSLSRSARRGSKIRSGGFGGPPPGRQTRHPPGSGQPVKKPGGKIRQGNKEPD